ncbi:hypothetical protein PG997_007229 [Apiospora hydei]|uniref:Rhodopsin domain-containing protein n=1 Tax=Apiospora hydei TaxID=1337664 RepID=A0ABR1W7E8_9PEZI
MRLLSRLRGPKKLWADDWLIISAWLLCALSAILWQNLASYIYVVRDVVVGNVPPSPTFAHDSDKAWKVQIAILVFWSTGILMVKLSFLLFFRRLRRNVAKGQYLWWASLFMTVSTYFVWIGIIPYKCLTKSLEMKAEGSAEQCAYLNVVLLVVNCVSDVATDLLSESSCVLPP